MVVPVTMPFVGLLRPVMARADEAIYTGEGRNRAVAHDGTVASLAANPDTTPAAEPRTASTSARD